MPAPDNILKLIDQFYSQLASYRSSQYNEAQVRNEFIEPFFQALGWDVYNKDGNAYAYKDVIYEDSIKVAGATKAPDYAFRIGGTRKFFVEAKKPSVNLKDEITPAYQLRRYAWSAKLPLSILTDFEEFAVYDCRPKPDKSDKASTERLLMLTYLDYPNRWNEIYDIFSKDAVLKGSFDQYAETVTGKRGTTEVDDAFLSEIERWRDLLAHNIALRNPTLSQRDLNYAIQMTIDRLIFLRICEDRGIEFYGQLQSLLNGGDTYARLCQLFHKADERYNSGLFHFHTECDQNDTPDTLTTSLRLDDKPLKDILGNLYYPDSPYAFSVLPADILGQVYERFLGKVIRLTTGHHAVVEEKPEVKKAGGVFYTPTFIVEYIVKNTLGKLLEGKTPGQEGLGKGTPIRVLDMSCGSGSFLLGAYQYLLDWYQNGYSKEPEKWFKGASPRLYQVTSPNGAQWKLTTYERKRILLDHIYGVDIDSQAVEVTKLSLLLKVLEGESEESIGKQLSMFRERALPDLASNIKCGNSLIGPDFYTSQSSPQETLPGFDQEEQYRINAFDWQREFATIFGSTGGFDVIIGNPPYIRIQTIQEWIPESAEYFKRTYRAANTGNYDIYVVFIERGLSLLNTQGRLGFIMPSKFWQVKYGEPLRRLLSSEKNIGQIVGFTNNQIFDTAFVNTCILVLSKTPTSSFQYVEIPKVKKDIQISQALINAIPSTVSSSFLSGSPWIIKSANSMELIGKLAEKGMPLEKCTTRIFQGLKTSADKIYVLNYVRETNISFIGYSPHLNCEVEIECGLLHILIKGTEMRRFMPLPAKRMVLFPYEKHGTVMRLIPVDQLKSQYPNTYGYLKANEKYLRDRESSKMNHSGWYGYGRNQALDVISLPKLLTPDLAPRSSFLLDANGEYFVLGGAAGGYGIIPITGFNYLYLLGILNSQLLNFYITSSGQQVESGYYSFEARFIRSAPIRVINFSDPTDVKYHDQLVAMVERMILLHQQLASSNTPNEKTLIQRHIDTTDHQIDTLVYELYGLTDDEIKLVEEM